MALANGERSPLCNNYASLRSYVRDNQNLRYSKSRPFFMVDSTYLIACNPNSMRDAGPARNAKYRINDPVENEIEKERMTGSNFNPALTMLSISPDKARQVRDTMNSRCNHVRPNTALNELVGMSSTFFTSASRKNLKPEHPNLVEPHTIVKVNDYTKNISLPIFSPSLNPKASASTKTNSYF